MAGCDPRSLVLASRFRDRHSHPVILRRELARPMRRAATALAVGIATVETLLATFSSPAAESPHFVFRSWRAEDGLPQNKVSAIQQTRDGYLWVGTYSGLARFDGVSFTVFHDNNTPAMRNSRVTSLFEAEDGTLWIGHESGDVTRMKEGIFHAVPPPEWLAGKIHTIAADAAGDIWLLNELGFIARVRDRLVLSPLAGSVAKIVQMAALQNGGIAIDREGFLSVLQDGTVRLVEPDVVTTNSYLQGIGPSRNGDLWLLSDLRVRRWSQVTGVMRPPRFRSWPRRAGAPGCRPRRDGRGSARL